MPRDGNYPHPIGLRVTEEQRFYCRLAGGGQETPGARALLQRGINDFRIELGEGQAATFPEQLRAIADQLEAAATVSGSGAALLSKPTPAKIDRLRRMGAAVIVTSSGVLVPGLTPDGADALLVLDLDGGQLAITATDGTKATVEIGEAVPALGSLASLLSGTLTRCWETVRAGHNPTEAPQGQRRDWGLTIWASSERDSGCSRIELAGGVIVLHSTVLLMLAAELFGLLARRSTAQLEAAEQLEQLLASPSADAPAVALCWERSHGE